MKENLLKGLVGIGMLALAFGVNAETITSIEEGNNTISKDATVGTVENSTYNVEISWGNFEYNWIYNEETLEYEWEAAHEDTGYINITDNSNPGTIEPLITWDAEDKYDFVDAVFKFSSPVVLCNLVEDEDMYNSFIESNHTLYDGQMCEVESTLNSFVENEIYYKETIFETLEETNSVTPFREKSGSQGGSDFYVVSAELVNNYEKELTTPTSGEKIGTFTITIEKNS